MSIDKNVFVNTDDISNKLITHRVKSDKLAGCLSTDFSTDHPYLMRNLSVLKVIFERKMWQFGFDSVYKCVTIFGL